MTRFIVGQHVERRVDVYDQRSRMRQGVVVRVYAETYPARPWAGLPELHYDELYEVQWDDASVKKGYLPHGLSRSAEKVSELDRKATP